MSDPSAFYKKEKNRLTIESERLKRLTNLLSLLRIGLFLIALVLGYFFYHNKIALTAMILIVLVVFISLILKHQSLTKSRKLCEELIQINSIEIAALMGNYAALPKGDEFIDASHDYSNDIDLFGKGSFFQYINRTATLMGKAALAQKLLANDISNIEYKQEVIRELATKVSWRQRFLALANTVQADVDHHIILDWIHKHNSFLPPVMRQLPTVFSFLSVSMILLTAFGYLSFYATVAVFFLGLLLTLPYLKKVNQLYLNASLIKDSFRQYHILLREIEELSIQSKLSLEQQQRIRSSQKKASTIFKEFSKVLDAFDQRNNMLFGVIGNGFFLWDLQQTVKIDAWIDSYKSQVDNWFEVIAYFDAQISLSNYVFNHPEQHFPKIVDHGTVIKAEKLGHPLLLKENCVSNDFTINKKDFHIITGANMAGKSTFLRTVSLSLMMANTGLPVCAIKMTYSPMKLITSMRTTDSLSDDSSYFYAEIMRLRYIVEQMTKEAYFIILDEILKGTNSKDKAMGSRKFIEKLVRSGSTGIIATHDLSLCEIEKTFPQIHNQFFDAKIDHEELSFDYKLKEGICTNMNASFLLKKMNLI